MINEFNIATLFAKAGFTRWPLLICSAVGFAIILERAWYFSRVRVDYQKFMNELKSRLRKSSVDKSIEFVDQFANPSARMAGYYLKHLKNPKRDSLLSREGTFLMEQVERRLRGLTAITHMAPLLGLLGTVIGLVVAFHQIEMTAGMIQAKDLAGGIWEALMSTVLGLIVAIPCMVSYYFFDSQSDRIFRRIQAVVHDLDEFFANHSSEVQK